MAALVKVFEGSKEQYYFMEINNAKELREKVTKEYRKDGFKTPTSIIYWLTDSRKGKVLKKYKKIKIIE